MWFAAVEFSFCSFLLSILLSGGAGGMTDAGGVTDAVDYSLTASLFFGNSSCSSYALYFPTHVPLRQTSSDFCSPSSAGLSLLLK